MFLTRKSWDFLILTCVLTGTILFDVSAQSDTVLSLILKGRLVNGKPIGVWEYYDLPGNLSLKFDHTANQPLFIAADTADFYFEKNGQWMQGKVQSACRFRGSNTTILEHFSSFPFGYIVQTAKPQPQNPLTIWLTFEVGPDGYATNPVVHGDIEKIQGISSALIQHFNKLPNTWIAAIDLQGQPIKCRFAVAYRTCKPPCSTPILKGFESRLLHMVSIPIVTDLGKAIAERTPIEEGFGIQFSPNDRYIMIKPNIIDAEFLEQTSPVIMDLQSTQTWVIPYRGVNGSWWLDNETILFNYNYSVLPNLLATYNLRTNSVATLSDSAIARHIISHNRRKLAFVSAGSMRNVYSYEFQEKKSALLYSGKGKVKPIAWAPDSNSLLVEDEVEVNNFFFILDSNTTKKLIIPIQNFKFGAWRPGGKLYFIKIYPGDYNSKGEIYEYDINTERLTPHSNKITNLREMSYSLPIDKFLVFGKGEVQIMGTEPFAKPEKLLGLSYHVRWSENGTMIGYVDPKDWQLHNLTLPERKSKLITNYVTLKQLSR